MNKSDVCKNILESIKHVKSCVSIFEAHVERVIEEQEMGVMHSPEAASDPDNLDYKRVPRKPFKSASDRLYENCSMYSHNRKGTLDGGLMEAMLETYLKSINDFNKNQLEDVIKYAREKGFEISTGTNGKGESVIMLCQH